MFKFFLSFVFFVLLIHGVAYSQDVESVVKTAKTSDPIKVSGGLGTDHVLYGADGIDPRRNSPYQYYLRGNINFTFFGQVSIPLSFALSNQSFNYTQPLNQQSFNQFGISPRYKWITAHAGWRNMSFSPYSLNGHTFLGGGVEVRPGKYTFSAMYGRLLKPVEYDSTDNANRASYRRMGMGLQAKYEDQGNQYGFNMFRSEDQISSLNTTLDSIGVTPEQNLVLGISLKQKISNKIQLEGEVANSIITKDSRFQDEYRAKTLGAIQENTTTVSYTAYNLKLNIQLKKARIGAGYERVAPGYRTHGAYYFNNDLENITVNYARPFFNNKVNLGLNIGTQRNNLDKSKISTMRRWVGAANLSWQVSKKINTTISYSNFQTYTNMRTPFQTINSANPYQFIDTLNFVQIAQSVNLNVNYNITSTEKRQQNLMLMLSSQQTSDQQGGEKQATGSTFYNMNVSYMYAIVPINLSFNVAGNGNWNYGQGIDSKIFGPTLGVTKGLFKKQLNSGISYSWNTTLNDNVSNGYVGSLRFINSLTVKKKHSFTLSFVWLNRESNTTTNGSSTFNEYTGRIGYNFRF